LGTTRCNGTQIHDNLLFTVLPQIEFDLIIGRNYNQRFGYRLVGVPTKRPGEEIVELDDLIPPITLDDIQPTPVTYPPLIAALAENAKINILEPCTHPLAIWDLKFTEEPTFWARYNYLSTKDAPETDRFINEMLDAGNISVAPLDAKLCFPLLAVNKTDDEGRITGHRTCVDLSPINGILCDDLYPLPTTK
jgi:hypothetical protein